MTDHDLAELQEELASARAEAARLRAHILDIDSHATPYGDLPEEPGYVGTYLLTAGALHRALGTVGHSSPSCPAEAQVAAVRALHQPNEQGNCGHCSNHGEYGHVQWPCPTALASGIPDRPARCTRCRGLGQIPDWTNWNQAHGEPGPKPCPDCPGEWPRAYPEWQQLVALAAPDSSADQPACCVCGTARAAYFNHLSLAFCPLCADCECGQALCVRTGTGDPAVNGAVAAAEFAVVATPRPAQPLTMADIAKAAEQAQAQRDAELQHLEASVRATAWVIGMTVVRAGPIEQVAATPGTLHRLMTAMADLTAPAKPTVMAGQIGTLSGLPLVPDDGLPPGEVHLRPHPRAAEQPVADVCPGRPGFCRTCRTIHPTDGPS